MSPEAYFIRWTFVMFTVVVLHTTILFYPSDISCGLLSRAQPTRSFPQKLERDVGYSISRSTCLVEGAGEVAFVKHVTVDENVNPTIPAEWNKNLRSGDYSFLCPDGSRQEEWTKACSLSKVSSHALMTAGSKTKEQLDKIIEVFSTGQTRFGSDEGTQFKLFDSGDYEGSNLLFKDSTGSLQTVGNRNTYDTWLSKEYIKGLEALDPETCSATANSVTLVVLVAVQVLAQALIFGD